MALILLEALGAGLLLVFIVWWTMFSGRPLDPPAEHPASPQPPDAPRETQPPDQATAQGPQQGGAAVTGHAAPSGDTVAPADTPKPPAHGQA